ncbi:MAG TPA: outer membrane beta-barrel protein, partial [Cyclobacteriaceae bacterium]|jgi:hypothetical protein|nr:outer membrane beta-barrel protein [Cyclobacteriaceae bacterium]
MKKLLLFLLTAYSSCAFAQKSFFGVNAGINVATQRERFEASPPATSHNSYLVYPNVIKPAFGLFYQKGFSGAQDVLAIRVEAKYMGMGYQQIGPSPFDKSIEIDYLTFPVSLFYSANKHLSLSAGLYLSFILGGTEINNQAITKTYHKNDNGFSFGLEHDVFKNFAMGVNYIIGIKNIILDDSNGATKYTNRALQFTLIYKFKKTS